MSQPSPCPFCGQSRYLRVPNLAVELKKPTPVMGLEAYQDKFRHVVANLQVCGGCGRMELFATDLAKLADVDGAHWVGG